MAYSDIFSFLSSVQWKDRFSILLRSFQIQFSEVFCYVAVVEPGTDFIHVLVIFCSENERYCFLVSPLSS